MVASFSMRGRTAFDIVKFVQTVAPGWNNTTIRRCAEGSTLPRTWKTIKKRFTKWGSCKWLKEGGVYAEITSLQSNVVGSDV